MKKTEKQPTLFMRHYQGKQYSHYESLGRRKKQRKGYKAYLKNNGWKIPKSGEMDGQRSSKVPIVNSYRTSLEDIIKLSKIKNKEESFKGEREKRETYTRRPA